MLPTLPRWFAHRGGGSLAPENTLAGIELAARKGFRAVEFDVMLSADGSPLLIHDETLERTTNGVGPVAAASDAYLRTLDAGEGEHLPFLADAAARCRRHGLLVNLEIKPSIGEDVRTAEVVARQCAELWRGAESELLFSSFSCAALEVVRNLLPGVRRGLLVEEVPADWLETAARLQIFSLHCDAARLNDRVLDEAAESRLPVLCYTVNRPEEAANLFARGVSALFTDRLDLFPAETTAYNGLHFEG